MKRSIPFLKFLAVFSLIYLSLVGILVVLFVRNIQPTQKDVTCREYLIGQSEDSFSWRNNHTLIFSSDNALFTLDLERCGNKPQSLFSLSNSSFLPCKSSDKVIVYNPNSKRLYDLSKPNNEPDLVPGTEELSPQYCDDKFITFRPQVGENKSEIYLFNIQTKKLAVYSSDPTTYTLIPIYNQPDITFRNNSNPGIYKENRLLLSARDFGYWEVSENKASIHFSKADKGKTEFYSLSVDDKTQKLIGVVDFSPVTQFQLSPDKTRVAFLDTQKNLIVMMLSH